MYLIDLFQLAMRPREQGNCNISIRKRGAGFDSRRERLRVDVVALASELKLKQIVMLVR